MVDEDSGSDPLIQPHMIRTLKNRPKLINFGMREELLEELERTLIEKRKPENVSRKVAEEASRSAADRATSTMFPVIENRMKRRFEHLNESIFSRL